MPGRRRLAALLFPEPERRLPGERWMRIAVRTAHLAAVAAYVGGSVYAVPADRLGPALACVVATGLLFVLLEAYGTCEWFFEVHGLATLVKIGLLLLVPAVPDARTALLFVALAIGAVSSHMPARLRHHSVRTGRSARERRG